MKKAFRTIARVLILTFVLSACNKGIAFVDSPDSAPDIIPENSPALIEIKFDTEKTPSELDDFLSATGAVSIERIFPDGGAFEERRRKEGLHLWYKVGYNPALMPATKAAEKFESFPGVAIVETPRDIVFHTTDDPYFDKQWHLHQSSGIDINVEEVWRNYTTGSSNVVVAVVDRGIELNHPDLAVNCIPGGNGKSFNFVTDSYTITGEEHGTHVGGIIASIRNNGIGTSGVAGGDAAVGQDGVQLLSCVIMGKNTKGEDTSVDPAEAIAYAADNGAVICQNSWGYPADTNKDGKVSSEELEAIKNMGTPATIKAAIDYFVKYAGCDNGGNQLPESPMKGGLVFFSAGNENIQYGQPAMYENALAVGSINSSGEKSSFSNYGSWVDICAPGSNIYSTIPGGYGSLSGTSMACPMVSGVAALILSYRGGYGFTNEDLKTCLLNGASFDKISTRTVGPLVDALGAVSFGIETPPEPIVSFNIKAKSNNVTISWAVPDRGNGKGAYATSIYYSTDLAAIETLDPLQPSSSVGAETVITSDLGKGETATHTIGKLLFEKQYYFRLVSCNPSASYAEPSPIASVITEANSAPVISSDVTLSDISLRSRDAFSFTLSISEPDGHQFTSEYIPGSKAESVISLGSQIKVTIQGSKAESGDYISKAIAKDSYGMESILEIPYRILDNEAPTIQNKLENIFIYTGSGTMEVPLASYFSDPDGDEILYSASASPAGIAVVATDAEKLYITPQKEGSCRVRITASDSRKASATQEIKAIIRSSGDIVSVYPTTVRDYLYIAGDANSKKYSVHLTASGSGALVLQDEFSASAFEPAAIDLSYLAPGRYWIEVITEEHQVTKSTIVKL